MFLGKRSSGKWCCILCQLFELQEKERLPSFGKGVGKIRKKVYLGLLMKHLARETGR